MLVTCTSAGTKGQPEKVQGLNGEMKALKATTLVLLLGIFSFGIYHLGQLGKESLWSTAAQLQDLSKTLPLPDQLHKLQEQLYHLRWSTKDVAEQALQEGLKQAKLPGVTGRAVQEIISQALENLVEIQVPMPDYALKSAGAAVIHSRTSPSFRNAKAKLFFYSLPLMDYMRSPELILEPENYPGNCWPFPGSQGHVFIKLSMPVIPRAVTMDHVSGTAFHGESISGAPKDFAVYGFKEEHEEQGTFLGQFTFLAALNPSQTFQLKNELPGVVNYIRLQVLSNWGHPDYTCLYRFRVHGHGIGRADGASQLDPGYEPWAVPESMVIKPLGVILFLSLGAIPGVSDQVKKAETSRPVCSPVTGQESGCVMDLPTGSSTKVAAPRDSKLATLKSSLLASAALELNITMSPPPAIELVLSAKSATSCGRRAEVTIAHHLTHNLPTTPTPWTPPTPTPWPVGKSRLSSSALHWPNHEKPTFSFILSSALWLPASP
ncbi:SUN domain-containing protein 3-like [Columba livia]|nr:SUN domain-containing protein 3-like [Columba livia]